MKYFLAIFLILFTTNVQAAPEAVTLNTPTTVGASSVSLQWTETVLADADFQCYRVMRETYAGAAFPIPTMSSWGVVIMVFLLALAAFRRIRNLAITGLLLFLISTDWATALSNPWISDCISPKSTVTFTDTGLNSDTTYYYKVYVISNDGPYYSVSNEITTTTLSRWSYTGNINYSHGTGTLARAFLLSDGKVITFSELYIRVEIYDPDTEQWTVPDGQPLFNSLLWPQACHMGTGDKFLLASRTSEDLFDAPTPRKETMIYDYSSDTWITTASFNTARLEQFITCLPDGRVLIAGGGNGDTAVGYLDSAEIYDPDTDTWSYTGSMNYERNWFDGVVLQDGRVLVAGGSSQSLDSQATAEIYDPSTGQWTLTGSMNRGRQSPTLILLSDGKVMAAGGYYANWDNYPDTAYQNTVEIYDPSTGQWTPTGSMNFKRMFFPLVEMADGKIMALGGRFQDEEPYLDGILVKGIYAFEEVEIYDPSSGTWSITESMKVSRENPFAVLLQDDRILAGGGTSVGGSWSPSMSVEIYDPNL